MTGANPLALSVLVPTYNSADFLPEAIASVVAQMTSDAEIVVVDDGSTDRTRDVVEFWIREGVVRYIRQENRGPAAARNVALASARGDLLMFLDSDDTLNPGCLEATRSFMDRYPEVGFVFTDYDIFDSTGTIAPSGVNMWRIFPQIPCREVEPGLRVFRESLTRFIIQYGAFMHTSGLTLRRSVANIVGPFREGYSYAEDDEYYARVAYHCTAGYIDRVLSRKRNHAGSLIHDPSNKLRNSLHLLELTDIQLSEYRHDEQLRRILDKKLKHRVQRHCWALIEYGRLREARTYLRRYLMMYPLHVPFHRLMAKSWLRSITRQQAS